MFYSIDSPEISSSLKKLGRLFTSKKLLLSIAGDVTVTAVTLPSLLQQFGICLLLRNYYGFWNNSAFVCCSTVSDLQKNQHQKCKTKANATRHLVDYHAPILECDEGCAVACSPGHFALRTTECLETGACWGWCRNFLGSFFGAFHSENGRVDQRRG